MTERVKFLKRLYEGKTISFRYHHWGTLFEGTIHIRKISVYSSRIFFTVEDPTFSYYAYNVGFLQVNLYTDLFRRAAAGFFNRINQYIPLHYYMVGFGLHTYRFDGCELLKIK